MHSYQSISVNLEYKCVEGNKIKTFVAERITALAKCNGSWNDSDFKSWNNKKHSADKF
jgi:hypothetical protein